MNHHPVRRVRAAAGRDVERGAATLFVAITAVGLLGLLGLVVDGGAKVRAAERSDTLAAEAARAAGQAVDLPGVMAGRQIAVDPARARAAASAYLTTNGVTGTVNVSPGGRAITVEVTTSQPTVLLALIGIPQITAHGSAHATLLRGINEVIP